MEWVYDFTDSSTSTRSTVAGPGSPRCGPGPSGGRDWSDTGSQYGYSLHNNPAEHLYAHIPDLVHPDHLYHTVDHQDHQDRGDMLEVSISPDSYFSFLGKLPDEQGPPPPPPRIMGTGEAIINRILGVGGEEDLCGECDEKVDTFSC